MVPSSDSLPVVWSLLRLDNLHKLSLALWRQHPPIQHGHRLSSPNYGVVSFRLSFTESVGDFDYHDDASITLLRHLPNIETIQPHTPILFALSSIQRAMRQSQISPSFIQPHILMLGFAGRERHCIHCRYADSLSLCSRVHIDHQTEAASIGSIEGLQSYKPWAGSLYWRLV